MTGATPPFDPFRGFSGFALRGSLVDLVQKTPMAALRAVMREYRGEFIEMEYTIVREREGVGKERQSFKVPESRKEVAGLLSALEPCEITARFASSTHPYKALAQYVFVPLFIGKRMRTQIERLPV